MSYEGLILEKSNGVATLTLNRPEKLNALTMKMILESLPQALEDVRKDDGVRVLVITGAGRGFCSGADLGDVSKGGLDDKARPTWVKLEPLGAFALQLHNLGKPAIAAINGPAAGAGLSIALLCDIRIAADVARFSMAFVLRGLVPDCGATYTLPRLIGSAAAFEMMYTGRMVDASEAERTGLVNRVVPLASLMKVAGELAGTLAKGPPIAMGLIKKAVYKGMENDLDNQLLVETYSQNIARRTEDHEEGVKAFLEKREPLFRGL